MYFVLVKQSAPENFTAVPLQRGASFDGDADRLMYYFVDAAGEFQLLVGDLGVFLLYFSLAS